MQEYRSTQTQTHIAIIQGPVVYRLLNDIIAYASGCASYSLSSV